MEYQFMNKSTTMAITGSKEWKVVDIIYISIVAPIMLCALLEWFLWLAAFCYCLCKAFKKAENVSTKILVCFMLFLFVGLRSVYLHELNAANKLKTCISTSHGCYITVTNSCSRISPTLDRSNLSMVCVFHICCPFDRTLACLCLSNCGISFWTKEANQTSA